MPHWDDTLRHQGNMQVSVHRSWFEDSVREYLNKVADTITVDVCSRRLGKKYFAQFCDHSVAK